VISVSLTLFLTSNVILLCITTSLGKELLSPLQRRRAQAAEPAVPTPQPEV